MVRWRWSRRREGAHPGSVQRSGWDPIGEVEPGLTPAASPVTEDGPRDLTDPSREAVRRLDLGSLLVPALPDVEYRFEVTGSGDDQRVVAVVAVAARDGSSMRLTVHAAPRAGGLWDEVRAELLRSAPAAPTSAAAVAPVTVTTSVTDGPFGLELWTTTTPAAQAEEPPGLCRQIGIEGSRWLLRARITPPADATRAAASEPEAATKARGMAVLEDVLRATVVMRGERAMPAGADLPLKLPTEPDLPDLDDPNTFSYDFGRRPPIGTATSDPRRVSYEVIAAPAGGLSRNLTTWG